ncbi:hypothetical protein CF327_g3145 [Tilletia walkeri]|nr:hypothetical protein CF327_g3145 [Tilletia walkeri]
MPSPLSASPTATPGSQSQLQRQQSGDSYLLQQQQQQQLQQQRRTPSPLPPYLQHYYNNSQLQDAISTNERAQSVPPAEMRSPSALNHRASPIDTTAAGLAKRRTTVHLDDAMTKRPMSPHITSATPTSASVRHSALYYNNPAFQHDRQSSLPGLGSTSPTSPAFAGTSAISKRDSIHSPLSTGPMNAPWLHEQGRFVGQVSGISDDDDDEAGKGHGGRISVPPSRPDSKPLFPLAHSPQPMAGSSVVVPTLLAPSAPLTTTGLSPVKYGPLSAESSGQPTTSPIIVPQARRGAMNLKKESKMRVGPNGERKSRKRSKARRRARRAAAAAAAAAGGTHDAALSLADVAERNHRRMNSNETTHSSQSGRYGPYYTSHHRRTHTNEAASYPLSHRPALSSMRSIATILLFSTMSALLHPRTTCTRIGRWAVRTCREIDNSFRDPRTRERVWKPEWLDAYVPFLIWLGVSLASTGTVIVFHTKVFTALDELSQTLQRLGLGGRFVMGGLIFLTTFPPMPLYSTLIVLCGFSFGMIEGFIISYIAALSGAITVFILSRTMLKGWMTGLLNKSGGLKKVVRAIEKQPKLLFLIRLAPYPYNLMNTLLASSPTLTFKTYTMCTALALPKLLVHTGLGTSIKNFAAYHGAEKGDGSGSGTQQEESEEEKARSATAEKVKRIAGLVGVLLCIGIFLYLMHVARKAVDNLDDEDGEGEKVEGSGSRRASAVASSSSRRHARRGTRSSASSSFSVRGGGPIEAERQRLYPGAGVDFDDEDDEDEDEDLEELDDGGDSPYSDDSDFYSDEDDFSYSDDDDDEDNLPALDGGRAAGDDSFAGSSSSSRHHQQRPTYGRTHTADAEIDMREVGYDRRGGGGGLGSAGSSGQSPGGIVDRFKAGLGLGGNASGPSSKTRYAPLPHSDGQGVGSGSISQPTSAAVQLSVVSSISTPMSSLPASLANGSVQGGRRAVVVPGGSSGAGVLGARPRVSGLGERSGFMPTPPPPAPPSASAGPASTRPASASAITSMGPPPPPPPAAGGVVGTNRTRAFPLPRLGPDGIPVGPAAGGYGGPSMLGTIVGTPGVGPSSSSAGGGPSLAPSFMTGLNTLSATTSSSASGTPDAGSADMSGLVDGEGGGMGMSMEDRIAEMEKSAEEYFSSGRRWTQSSTSTGGPATAAAAAAAAGPGEGPAAKVAAVGVEEAAPTADDDLVEMQRLAQQQRRGGPRSASEMGVEEARYGN